jgi:hypothetical protein
VKRRWEAGKSLEDMTGPSLDRPRAVMWAVEANTYRIQEPKPRSGGACASLGGGPAQLGVVGAPRSVGESEAAPLVALEVLAVVLGGGVGCMYGKPGVAWTNSPNRRRGSVVLSATQSCVAEIVQRYVHAQLTARGPSTCWRSG